MHFRETKNTLYQLKIKEQDGLSRQMRAAMFPNEKIVPSSTIGLVNEESYPNKRKQPTSSTVSDRPRKKLVTIKHTNPLRQKQKLVTLKIDNLHRALPLTATCSNPSLQLARPVPPPPSASAIAHELRVRKIYDQGAIVITPCTLCFTTRKQCIKSDLSGICFYCLYMCGNCEGAVSLGEWVERDGKMVCFVHGWD